MWHTQRWTFWTRSGAMGSIWDAVNHSLNTLCSSMNHTRVFDCSRHSPESVLYPTPNHSKTTIFLFFLGVVRSRVGCRFCQHGMKITILGAVQKWRHHFGGVDQRIRKSDWGEGGSKSKVYFILTLSIGDDGLRHKGEGGLGSQAKR